MRDISQEQDQALEELIAELAQQFIEELDQGKQPDIDIYAQRHPDASDAIRGTLGALQTMRSMSLDEMTTIPAGGLDLVPRKTLGDYRIIRELGRGGMGVVYEAVQISLDRRVALKILPYAAMLNPRSLQRFRNEVTAAARLEHPNVVDIYGVACERGVHHYAMRLIEGLTLAEIINQLRSRRDRGEALPNSISSIHHDDSSRVDDNANELTRTQEGNAVVGENAAIDTIRTQRTTPLQSVRQGAEHFRSIAEFGIAIAEALEHSHQMGVVHRDVKPSNLMIDDAGKPWITDFGLAQVETGAALTLTGDLLGTARYMSPEQLKAKRALLDNRTDIYSLGVTLYETLTLELPFDSENRQELFRQIMSDEPRKLRTINPSIPHDLQTIILKAIEKNPEDRYATAQDLADDLVRFVGHQPIHAKSANLAQRLQKWSRRNQWLVGSTVAMLIVCTIGLTVFSVLMLRERNKLTLEQARATENFDYAKGSLNDFLIEFANVDLSSSPATERQRRRMLSRAASHFNKLADANPKRADLQRSYADALTGLGKVSASMGEFNLADGCYEQCISILEKLRDNIETPHKRQELDCAIATSYLARGSACSKRQPAFAEKYFYKAITICRSLPPLESIRGRTGKVWLAVALTNYGIYCHKCDRPLDAIEQYNQALEVCSDSLRGAVLHNMAVVQKDQGNLEEAMQLINDSIKCPGQTETWSRNHLETKAAIHFEQNELELALAACQDAISICRKLAQLKTRASSNLSADNVLSNVGGNEEQTYSDWFVEWLQFEGRILAELGQHEQAFESFDEARSIHVVSNGNRLIQDNQLITRRDIEKSLAQARAAMGQIVAADYTRNHVKQLEDQIKLIPPAQPGITFAVGSSRDDEFRDVAIDDSGFVYVVGWAARGVDFQAGPVFQGVVEEEYARAVVCKYAPDGAVLWIRTLGAPLDGNLKAITIDQNKSIFVSGTIILKPNIAPRFGESSMTPPLDTLGPANFVTKLDTRGKVLWTKWTGIGVKSGSLNEHAVAATPDGGVIVGGTFRFDSKIGDEKDFVLVRNTRNGTDQTRGFVAKFASDGAIRWARVIEADVVSKIGGVESGPEGNVFICGISQPLHSTVFGCDTAGTFFKLDDSSKSPDKTGFLAMLNAEGATLWVRPQLSAKTRGNLDVASGTGGRIYLSTLVTAPMDLDGTREYADGVDRVERFRAWDPWDSNVSCWNSTGRLLWQRQLACGTGYVSANSLAPRTNGGVFVAGRMIGHRFFFEGDRFARHPFNGRDGLVLSIDGEGNLINKSFYTTGDEPSRVVPMAITANTLDQVAIVGWFKGDVRAPTGNTIHGQLKTNDGFLTILENADRVSKE